MVLVRVVQAVRFGLLDLDRVLELVDERPAGVDLLLTGPGAPPDLREALDCVRLFSERSPT